MTELAEFRHVRLALDDVMRAGGSVQIRDETLARRDPSEIREALHALGDAARERGMAIESSYDPMLCVTVVRWWRPSLEKPHGDLPAEHDVVTPPHPARLDSAPIDELRSSGWSS